MWVYIMGTYEGAFCPHLLSSVPSNVVWRWAVESRAINNPGFYRGVLGTFRSADVFVMSTHRRTNVAMEVQV